MGLAAELQGLRKKVRLESGTDELDCAVTTCRTLGGVKESSQDLVDGRVYAGSSGLGGRLLLYIESEMYGETWGK